MSADASYVVWRMSSVRCVIRSDPDLGTRHFLHYTVVLYSAFVMPFRPPLSLQELRDIGRRRDPADVIPLPGEIKRLHAIVRRANQLQASLGPESNGGAGLIVGCLRRGSAAAFRREVRDAFSGRIVYAGRCTAKRRARLVEAGLAALVAFGRPFIANPDPPERIANGWPAERGRRGHAVRRRRARADGLSALC